MLASKDCYFVYTASGNYEQAKEQARLSKAENGGSLIKQCPLGKIHLYRISISFPSLWIGQSQNLSQKLYGILPKPRAPAKPREKSKRSDGLSAALNVIGWKMEMPTHKNHPHSRPPSIAAYDSKHSNMTSPLRGGGRRVGQNVMIY